MNKKNLIVIIVLLILALTIGLLIARWLNEEQTRADKNIPGTAGSEEAEAELNLSDRYNILLLGLDADFGGTNRTDTIIFVSIDTKAKKALMVSVPRDTRVKIKGGWEKMNSAYVYGGIELVEETVEDFLKVKIDNYVIVNFQSLIQIVDVLGGLEIDVPIKMYHPTEGIDLEPGKQMLDGKGVLAYSRFRYTEEGDIGRAKRQQQVIELLLEKIKKAGVIHNLEIGGIILKNIETDMPATEILKLIAAASKVVENGIDKFVVPGENAKIDGIWYWEPDLDALKTEMEKYQ